MTTLATPAVETDSVTRATRALMQLEAVVGRVRGPEFEVVHAGRWRHVETNDHVETGWSYGEGRVRVFLNGGRKPDAEWVLHGGDDDLVSFEQWFRPGAHLAGRS